jgi:hypothetical protein
LGGIPAFAHDGSAPTDDPVCAGSMGVRKHTVIVVEVTVIHLFDENLRDSVAFQPIVTRRAKSCWHRVLAVVITTTMLLWQSGAPAFSLSPSLNQIEAASVTAHGGGTSLQDCMTLWDAATHMRKLEWKAACKRTMVVAFPDSAR